MYIAGILLFTLLIPALATLTPVSTTGSTVLFFGAAQTTHTYALAATEETVVSVTVETLSKASRRVLSRYETNHVRQGHMHNITIDFFFESWVGTFDYAVIVNTLNRGVSKTYKFVDTHSVYGIVFYQGKNIVSGDESQGLKFSHYLTKHSEPQYLNIMTHAPEGVDMTPVLTTRATFSKASNLLPKNSINLSKGRLSIRPADFMTGAALIDVVCPGLVIDGEVFETVIEVEVSNKPRPPIVLVSANGTFVDGKAEIDAVLKNAGEEVVLKIDGFELHGESKNGRYVFFGNVQPGLYEHVDIRNNHGDGIVNERLVVEVLDGGEKKVLLNGKRAKTALIVITLIVAAVVIALVAIALYIYKRSKDDEENFVDQRVEHIVRDAYGRGSVQV